MLSCVMQCIWTVRYVYGCFWYSSYSRNTEKKHFQLSETRILVLTLNRYRWYCLYGDIWIENDKRMCDVIVRKKHTHTQKSEWRCARSCTRSAFMRARTRTQRHKEMTPQRIIIRSRDNFQSHIVLHGVNQ